MSTPLLDELERRQSIADRVEAFFLAHPAQWLLLTELVAHFGSAVTVRIRLDLRKKRGLNVHWNGLNGAQSAYRYLPYFAIGPPADEPRDATLFTVSDRKERR